MTTNLLLGHRRPTVSSQRSWYMVPSICLLPAIRSIWPAINTAVSLRYRGSGIGAVAETRGIAHMANLVLGKDFLRRFAELPKPIQRAVDNALAEFREHTHAGLHLEKIKGARDPRMMTIKITDGWRGVVVAPMKGDVYTLQTVMTHDDANRYAKSHVVSVNQILGSLEVRDQTALETMEPTLPEPTAGKGLFDHVKDRDLVRLGVDPNLLTLARKITTEKELDTFANLIPSRQADALLCLAMGMTADETWSEVAKYLVDGKPPEDIDPNDLAAAAERTPDQYVVASGPEHLAEILSGSFAEWRTFLHPLQHRLAYRESSRAPYRGPVLVSGGAGTGKTVTAVHRAAFLAHTTERSEQQPDILLTTFSTGLANALERQIATVLPEQELRSRVEVRNIDKLAYEIASSTGERPRIIKNEALKTWWENAARNHGGPSATFLAREWEQVVLAQNVVTEGDYFRANRRGRGRPIHNTVKRRVWPAIEEVADRLRATGQRTHLQVADEAARILGERGPRYQHAIVDEGQDLHPAQWRLLRAAVPSGPNDLFIVSDPNQRIYDRLVSLERLGIRVRGRSYRLTTSYRTTQEILSWAVRVLDGEASAGLDDRPDNLASYRSEIHGQRPILAEYPTPEEELDGLVETVAGWRAAGVAPSEIGVAIRTRYRESDIRARLSAAGIAATDAHGGDHPADDAHSETNETDAVRVDTMHAMKGLEFRCMAVIGLNTDEIPPPAAVTAAAEDPVAHKQDLHRERCLLYMALARPRDLLYVSHLAGQASDILTTPAH